MEKMFRWVWGRMHGKATMTILLNLDTLHEKVCGYLLVEHLIPKSWALIWSWSPLCCYNSLHSSGKAFHYMLEPCCRDLLQFSHKNKCEVGTDVGRLGLARSRRSNSSQRCSMGLRSGLCAGQSSSSTTISTNHIYMDLALCKGALSC
ncbi:hypothetical protein J4Q44_G00157440 [Coregonus suidteri]|uniref:Uncharacterized protein n=1 Tax=Coregonus suidteri TaxID=861788 RepID=A0AAN8QS62_9TELE